MDTELAPIRTISAPAPDAFRAEIVPAAQPVVLKGLVDHWPAVAEARKGAGALVDYLMQFDAGKLVETIFGAPEIEGKFFYGADLKSLNFTRRPAPLAESLAAIQNSGGSEAAAGAIYIQSVPAADYAPGFEQENTIDLAAPQSAPRLWIGNRLTVQTHFDLSENIACVVAGRRRFTLFPPEQLVNLYPGPFELTLAGPPVSMARLDDPDFARYPKFKEALAQAQVADLEPGDALYIPYFWWHHVRSLEPFNMLVNYWWNDARADLGSPFDCMLHALVSLRDMPERYRDVWRVMFDHYVFKTSGDPVAHLPAHAQGALGAHTPQMAQRLKITLLQAMAREAGVEIAVRPLGKRPGG
jgi:hypothetical protein